MERKKRGISLSLSLRVSFIFSLSLLFSFSFFFSSEEKNYLKRAERELLRMNVFF